MILNIHDHFASIIKQRTNSKLLKYKKKEIPKKLYKKKKKINEIISKKCSKYLSQSYLPDKTTHALKIAYKRNLKVLLTLNTNYMIAIAK